ncbi:hypothetical protein F4782DRAFT_252796 [Xylaria castorea]|nr:hypothetical protein F4782DRAFT_252796 [Xylaria castorea]
MAPTVESRIYRSSYRVESFSRKQDRQHSRRYNNVTVYNWNCRNYDPDDPRPDYSGVRRGHLDRDREPGLQPIAFENDPQEQSPHPTARYVGSQEPSLILTALEDLPIGPYISFQDVDTEGNAIGQADRNNAEWRHVTREFVYPAPTRSFTNFQGFRDNTKEAHDTSQESHDSSHSSNSKRKTVMRGEGNVITARDARIDYPLVTYGKAGDRIGQQSLPTVPYASSIGTDQSSVFDDDNNNGRLSYGVGDTEPDKGDWDDCNEENTDGLSGNVNFPFPFPPRPSPRLLCEFIGYAKCKRTFAPEDFDAWVEHIIIEHMKGKLPVEHLCWFCDDQVFRAEDPSDQGKIREKFEQSLSHIRDHMVEDGLKAHDIRPDYLMNEHLRESGLISDPVYNRVRRFTELPNVLNGIVPSTFIFPKIHERDEPASISAINLEKKKERRSAWWRRKSAQNQLRWEYLNGVHPPTIRKPSISALVGGLHKFFWPRIRDDFLRVSWTCRCGEPLYIDVPPQQKQAAFAFAQAAGGTTASVHISSNGGNSHPSRTSGLGSNIGSGMVTNSSRTTKPLTPTHNPMPANRVFLPTELAPGTKKYLLLCVNTGPYQIQLGHIDMTHIVWDVALYSLIREMYQTMRGRLARNKFIVPKTIEYVKFELVRRSNTGECIGNYEKDSIPGKEEMARKEYTLTPYPPRIGRIPIQPHVFMHSFLNPGDHLGGLAVLQLPKKVGRRLKCTAQPINPLDVPYGWGVYIVEGVNMFLVSLLLAGILALVTLAVLLWSTLKGDVQGGTGIGQYALAIVAFVTGAFAWKPLRDMT